MEKSEDSTSERFALATRLTALLGRILDNLYRSIQVIAESAEGSQLPYVQGDDGDVELAAMYLQEIGFQHDGMRLHREYWQLSNKCIDEWLSGIADVESQEFQRDQLLGLFGQFPSRESPTDPTVADRRVAILGLAMQFSDYLSRLISSVNASAPPIAKGKLNRGNVTLSQAEQVATLDSEIVKGALQAVIDGRMAGVLSHAIKASAVHRANATMTAMLNEDLRYYEWTLSDWVSHLSQSRKTIIKTDAWKRIQSYGQANREDR